MINDRLRGIVAGAAVLLAVASVAAGVASLRNVQYDANSNNAIRTLMDARAGLLYYGSNVAVDTDARFTDARTPTAHTQSYTTITGLGTSATQPDTYFEPAISGDPDTSKYWRADKTWQTVVGGGGGDMYKADNLSGLADAATARGNLGLGTASTHADTEYEDAGALSGHESTYNHANYDTAYDKVNTDSAAWDSKQAALSSGGDGTAILDGVKIRSLKNSAGITWYTGGDSIRVEVAAVSHDHDNMTTQGNTFNGASQLVQMTSDTKLPSVDGSLLTNLPASGFGALTNPSTLSNNDNTKLVTAQISTTASYGDQTLDALASYIYGAYQFSADNTIINDLVGSRNLTNVGGTVTGSTGGKNGAYALLNGSTQSFYITPPTAPRHTAISLWFYHGGDIGLRVVCGGKTNSASHFSAYIMSNTLYCRLEANASVYDSVGVTANAWHHLLMYCDSTANKFYAYVDGSPTANTPVTFDGSPQNFVDNYYLGYLDKAEHDHLNGRIDEAIIWHSDSTQILNGTSAVTTFANTLYNSSSGKFLVPGGVQKYDISTLKTSSLEPAFTNLAYSKLPTGGGTWSNGGDLSITGGNVGVGCTPSDGYLLDMAAPAAYQRLKSTIGTNLVYQKQVKGSGRLPIGIDI